MFGCVELPAMGMTGVGGAGGEAAAFGGEPPSEGAAAPLNAAPVLRDRGAAAVGTARGGGSSGTGSAVGKGIPFFLKTNKKYIFLCNYSCQAEAAVPLLSSPLEKTELSFEETVKKHTCPKTAEKRLVPGPPCFAFCCFGVFFFRFESAAGNGQF